MEQETLYCLKAHTYDMKRREPGEPMLVRRRHSAVLIALGRATREQPNVIPFAKRAQSTPETASAARQTLPAVNDDKSPTEVAEDARKALRAEYKALFGKDAHGRTSIETLRSEIERKKAE